MAIALEFLDFIVPIAVIKEKYPGGWAQCLKDREERIGETILYDEHLWRDGAMSIVRSYADCWCRYRQQVNGTAETIGALDEFNRDSVASGIAV